MLKIGDKVRVKSWNEILETLDDTYHTRGVFFPKTLKDYCGKEFTIDFISLKNTYCLGTGLYFFAEEWLVKINPPKYFVEIQDYEDFDTVLMQSQYFDTPEEAQKWFENLEHFNDGYMTATIMEEKDNGDIILHEYLGE